MFHPADRGRVRVGRQTSSGVYSSSTMREYRDRHDVPRGPPRSYHPSSHAQPVPTRRTYDDRVEHRSSQRSRPPKLSPPRITPPEHKSRRVESHRSSSHHSRQGGLVYFPRCWPCQRGKQIWSAADLRQKFPQLYIPSTFSHAVVPEELYDIDMSGAISSGCQFYILDRKKDESGVFSKRLAEKIEQPEPTVSGLSFKHSVKVILLSTPAAADLIKRATDVAESGKRQERSTFIHQNRLFSFLHGVKSGKSEPLGIGGHWHPVLDGSDPEKDPGVLIKTAIRCTRELTGLDLSSCTHWYKFVELRYLRPEKSSPGDYSDRMETTTVLMPDVWSLMPSEAEWKERTAFLTDLLSDMKKPESGTASVAAEDAPNDAAKTSATDASETTAAATSEQQAEKTKEQPQEDTANVNDASYEDSGEVIVTVDEVIGDCARDMKEELSETNTGGQHGGIKSADIEIKEVKLELPSTPHILINPARSAKDGVFDCKMSYLVSMLDYSPSNTKEHSFELSLFAELFNQCVARCHAVSIISAFARMNTSVLLSLMDEGKSKAPASSDNDKSLDDQVIERKRPKLSEEEGAGEGQKSPEHAQEEETPKPQRHPNKPISSPSNKYGYSKEASGYRTIRPDLLLSFSYFDHKNTRSIARKDLLAIIESTDLCLTRTETTKMVDCACGPSASHFYYRNLTDALSPDNTPIWPLREKSILVDSAGRFLPEPPSNQVFETDGMVTFRGRTIHLDNAMKYLEDAKREQNELNVKIGVLESEIVDLRQSNDAGDRKAQRLEKEVETLRNILAERKKALAQAKETCAKFESCLGYTRHTLKRLLNRELEEVLGNQRKELTPKQDDAPKEEGLPREVQDDPKPEEPAGTTEEAVENSDKVEETNDEPMEPEAAQASEVVE